MGNHATENSRTVSAVSSFQRLNKQCLKVRDKPQYVPCQFCKNFSYPFKQKGPQNKYLSDTVCLVGANFQRRLMLFKCNMVVPVLCNKIAK